MQIAIGRCVLMGGEAAGRRIEKLRQAGLTESNLLFLPDTNKCN